MDWNIRIETPRLVVREFVLDDWKAVHRYASDLDVVRFMIWGPNSEADSHAFIANVVEWQSVQPRRVFDLAVVTKEDQQLIGSCGFHLANTVSEGASQSIGLGISPEYNVDPSSYTLNKHGAMGYCFSKEAWGQGYATEAATAVLHFAFEQLGLHKMFATCDVENTASLKVLERIGMRREGHLLEDILIKQHWRDSYLYAIVNRDWNPL